jgi:heme exporter protein A
MTLQAHSLCLRRGERLLLDALSFAVPRGGVLFLRGANGAGKSSLLRALAGFLSFDRGEVYLAHEPLKGTDVHLFGQGDGLKGTLSLEEQLRFWTRYLHGDEARLNSALEEVGLTRVRDLPAYTLSAGQRRRLALALLLTVSRPLWLLDEPTTHLDAQGVALLEELIERHLQGGGMALVATHDHALSFEGETLLLGESFS